MSLQTKFAVLLTLLAVTTAAILAVALSFGGFLERELVKPFERTTSSLRRLDELKDRAGLLAAVIGEQEMPDDATHEAYEKAYENVSVALKRLDFERSWHESVGAGTAEALTGQVGEARRLAEAWLADGDASARVGAIEAQARVLSLVEAIERRLISDAPTALAYGDDLRRIHGTMTYSGIVAAALFVVLCVMFFRRWVTKPVRLLREAAVRIGAGDFQHRVGVNSDDELGVLSREVNRMAELVASMQVEAVEKERLAATGEMVRRLVHNIRNPLSAIRGLAEMSSRRGVSADAVKANQSLIIESVDRFDRWLTDLLSVTVPKGLRLEVVEVAPWLRGLVEAHRPLARMRGVSLEDDVSGPEHAMFDHRHLEHAIVSILTNAIQASPEGSTVRVGSGCADQTWTISVADEGGGVAPELIEKIFRPYFTTKRDGTGIGLAIAREVVRGHGGEITVESPLAGGSVFCVRIPVGKIQPNHAVDPSQLAGIITERESTWDPSSSSKTSPA
jgi:signal transduction histidine kinase